MNEQIPAVDWTAVKPQATGDRHYKGAGLGSGPWKCPACGKDNSRDLSLGCEHCGSGTNAARHVGVDSPARKPSSPTVPTVQTSTEGTESPARIAFTRWLRAQDQLLTPGIIALCEEAFLSGIAYAEKNLLQHLPVQEAKPDLPLTGTAASRTLIAALKFFRDGVLTGNPEEIVRGEWLSVAEVDRLIEQMEEA